MQEYCLFYIVASDLTVNVLCDGMLVFKFNYNIISGMSLVILSISAIDIDFFKELL